ncbi:hypothetical protein SAMN04488123_11012 [Natribacillus halophilus]|uniref:Uncharacterized protein n=2 Tax=Natribacillus halophilus TaxID=549003 RepID=A0A1G8PYA6_9BACI|nr:hypothetical protein SAMN04488123_11012 [Natribacillus halophilus]
MVVIFLMIRNLDFVRRGLTHLNVDVDIRNIERAMVDEAENHCIRYGEPFMIRVPFYHGLRDLGFDEEGVLSLDVVLFAVRDREAYTKHGEPMSIDYVGIFDLFIVPLEYQAVLEKRADEREEMEGDDEMKQVALLNRSYLEKALDDVGMVDATEEIVERMKEHVLSMVKHLYEQFVIDVRCMVDDVLETIRLVFITTEHVDPPEDGEEQPQYVEFVSLEQANE